MTAAAPGQQGPSEQELRELVLRSDQVRSQLAQMEAQREYLLEVVAETRRALSTLEHLSTAKVDDEVLVPLGAGAFVRARVVEPAKAVANLGSGVHAELGSADAATRLKARVENLDNAQTQLARDIARLSDELSRSTAVLEAYYGGG